MVHLLGDVINLQGDSFLFVEIGVKFKPIAIPRRINPSKCSYFNFEASNEKKTWTYCCNLCFCVILSSLLLRVGEIGVPPVNFNKKVSWNLAGLVSSSFVLCWFNLCQTPCNLQQVGVLWPSSGPFRSTKKCTHYLTYHEQWIGFFVVIGMGFLCHYFRHVLWSICIFCLPKIQKGCKQDNNQI